MYKDPHNRPVNLKLSQFKFPLNALMSISHRLTGVALVFFIIEIFLFLTFSLASDSGYQLASSVVAMPVVCALNALALAGLLYHWLMGVRHLLEDYGFDVGVMHKILSPSSSLIIYAVLLAALIVGGIL